MNYKQFFNKILEQSANPIHEIPDDAINSVLDADTDPSQFKKDISVNGTPKSTVDDAKSLWDKETAISGTNSQEKKASISKVEKFISKLETFMKNLKNLDPEKRYTSIAVLADLVSVDPDMAQKYADKKAKIEKIKQAEELRKQAEDLEKEASDQEDSGLEDGVEQPLQPLPEVKA